MYKTYRFRMYPTDNQQILIHKTFGCYRYEIKLKYVSDNKYANLRGEKLKEDIKGEIRAKDKDLKGQMITQGTTPRRLTDLIG